MAGYCEIFKNPTGSKHVTFYARYIYVVFTCKNLVE